MSQSSKVFPTKVNRRAQSEIGIRICPKAMGPIRKYVSIKCVVFEMQPCLKTQNGAEVNESAEHPCPQARKLTRGCEDELIIEEKRPLNVCPVQMH
jgi:hypothetical protein